MLISDIHPLDLRTPTSPCSLWFTTRQDDGCIMGKCCWLIAPHLLLEMCRASPCTWNTTESCSYSVPSQQLAWLIFAREIQAGEVSSNQECRQSWASHQVVLLGLRPNCYSMELPVEPPQLPSVKIHRKLRLQIASPAWHRLDSLPAKFQLNLGSFLWITQAHQMGSSGVQGSEVPASNKIRLAKEPWKYSVWSLMSWYTAEVLFGLQCWACL